MSASDAAPLPRLGEVFFDVRGNSRSMRLSWYADTGVAVFSVWQAGRCTGTFRLPIDDLPRMIEILQRGPDRRRPRLQAADRSAGSYPPEAEPASVNPAGYGRPDEFPFDQYGPADSQDPAGATDDYEQADNFETAAYPRAEQDTAARGGRSRSRRRSAGYPDGQPYADSPAAYGESLPGYADSAPGYSEPGSDYRDGPAGYQDSAAGYEDSSPGYAGSAGSFGDAADDRGPQGRRPDSRRYAAAPDYPAQGERQPGAYWRDEADDYSAQSPGHERLADRHLAGYGEDRFVPPYVQAQDDAYRNDNPRPGAGHRRSAGRAAYPADRSEDSGDTEWHADQGWSDEGYSGGSDYRLPADPPPGPRHSSGRPDSR
jgi:hypothetical protein